MVGTSVVKEVEKIITATPAPVILAILLAYLLELAPFPGVEAYIRTLILIFIWQYLGFAVIIVQSSFRTAELQEMIEAATVDGASKIRILISVIIPNIRSGLLVLISLLLINSFR